MREMDWPTSSRPLVLIFLVATWLINSACTWKAAESQSLPPPRYDGFFYHHHHAHSHPSIIIEGFFDPVCPDTRDAWPPLKQALDFYGLHVALFVHLLPLPYHDNAYVASRAMHIVNALNTSYTFPLLEHFFEHQDKFYNAQTKNLSRVAVVNEIVKFTAAPVGNSYYPEIEAGFNDRKTDLKTRVSFKYSTSRGVSGTPTFYVNGFVLPDTGSPIDYNGWRKILDPLLAKTSTERVDALNLY